MFNSGRIKKLEKRIEELEEKLENATELYVHSKGYGYLRTDVSKVLGALIDHSGTDFEFIPSNEARIKVRGTTK